MQTSSLPVFLATLCLSLLMFALVTGDAAHAQDKANGEPVIVWHAVTADEIEGKGWKDTPAPFDRFPAKAEATVPPAVWGLSHDSAGLNYHFVTDAPTIQMRWSLTGANLAMPHMPATGMSGVDLYVRKSTGWRFVGNGRPLKQDDNLARFTVPAEVKGKAEFRLYLPLYNGTAKLEVGIPEGSSLSPAPPYPAGREKPVVFYGTSITQGGCASRPGMAFTSIVGRKLDVPVINLGFSGSGKMEPALADLLCDLDPSVIVLDCLHNMTLDMTRERIEPFVRRLRQQFPQTPILLAEGAEPYNPVETPQGKIVRETVEKMTQAGVPNLHYLPMRYALGDDGEGTVDGTHPTDLGMSRMAEAFAAGLAPLLPPAGK